MMKIIYNVNQEEIAEMMNKHMQSYLGKDVSLSKDDGYFFVAWSHIRRPFYVYTYAFGELVSQALYEKYTEDNTFIEKPFNPHLQIFYNIRVICI